MIKNRVEAYRGRNPLPTLATTCLLVFACAGLASCGAPPPAEEQIRASLARIEAAIEARDASAVMDELDDDFVYQPGQDTDMPRLVAARTLKALLGRYRDVSLLITALDVEPDPMRNDLAEARFNVLVTGGNGLLPDNGQLYRVESQWLLDDEWRLWRVDARRMLE